MQLNTLSKNFERPVFNSERLTTGQLVLRRFPVIISPEIDDRGEMITQELKARKCLSCGRLYTNRSYNFCTSDGARLPWLKD